MLTASISGPIKFGKNTRLCIQVSPPKNSSSTDSWVQFATLVNKRGNKLHIIFDSGVQTILPVNSPRVLGTLIPETFRMSAPHPMLMSNAMPFIEMLNVLADNRTVIQIQEAFDGIVYDCIAIYNPLEEENTKTTEIYPQTLRFDIGDIVKTLLEIDSGARLNNNSGISPDVGYSKIVKREMKVTKFGNQKYELPLYLVQRSYAGISQEEWNQLHPVYDVKLNDTQHITAIPKNTQEQIRRTFFNQYFRN
jgi:hypothetical protein